MKDVIGRIQLYEPVGVIPLSLKERARMIGALAINLKQHQEKLTEEGLFQDRWKQALPFPRRSGSSPVGAVIRDIILAK